MTILSGVEVDAARQDESDLWDSVKLKIFKVGKAETRNEVLRNADCFHMPTLTFQCLSVTFLTSSHLTKNGVNHTNMKNL
jgi:hypothetical protein